MFTSCRKVLDVLVLATLAGSAVASTIYVPADQPTIQAGINAAVDGDTVLVSPGTYTENIDFKGKAITVTSSKGPQVTIINGNKLGPVVTFKSGEKTTSVLSGFTLKNGLAPVAPYFIDGGGVAVFYSSATVSHNIITGNTGDSGGGISSNFGSPVITGNTITQNKAGSGGGVYIGGSSTAIVTNNVINGNTAYEFGGGLNLFAAGAVTVTNNRITNNHAPGGGGGQGGGIYIVNEADATLIQNLITGNSSPQGGGVFLQVPQSSTGLLFVNNTIANNNSADGSGVWAGGFDSNDRFFNNIVIGVAGETAFYCDTLYTQTPPTVEFTDAWASRGTGFAGSCGTDAGTNGDISTDPTFLGSSNYHLQFASPVIDAGTNSAPGLPSKDLDGYARVYNGVVDMGVYEFFPSSINFSPSTLQFGPQSVGTSSLPQSVALKNSGTAPLFLSITVTGEFQEKSNCSQRLAPGTACTINVVFRPTTIGPQTGKLELKDNASGSPQAVSLSGSGD